MSNLLTEKLNQMKNEINALKQAQKIPSMVKAFDYSFDAVADGTGVSDAGIYRYQVTYESGDNDIITEVYPSINTMVGAPNGTSQVIYFYAMSNMTVNLTSTRPIVSVVKIV